MQNISQLFMEYKALGLFLVAFAESSFFPIPPDILLIAISLKNSEFAIWYALLTTIGSVIGGLFGYFIGLKAGRPILKRFVSIHQIEKIEKSFKDYGGWAVAIAGFTPIPFKIFTIAAGVFKISKLEFTIASMLSRGARFFLEGITIFIVGDSAKYFLGKYLELITIAITLIVIFLYLIFKKTKMLTSLQKLWILTKGKMLSILGNHLTVTLILGMLFALIFAYIANILLQMI